MPAVERRCAFAVGSADVAPVATEQHVEQHADAGEQHEEQRPRECGGRVALLVDEHEHQTDTDRVERDGEKPVVLYDGEAHTVESNRVDAAGS